MRQAVEKPQPAPVWSWYFAGPRELHRALEEYTAFQDGTVVRRYGVDGMKIKVDAQGNQMLDANDEPTLEPEDPAKTGNEQSLAEVEMHAAQRRSEIDACMESIRRRYPLLWRLIDIHYRRGFSIEPRGWLLTAELLGLHRMKCPPLHRCPASPGDNRLDLDACRRHDKYHCHRARATFEGLTYSAIARLFDAHKIRSERNY